MVSIIEIPQSGARKLPILDFRIDINLKEIIAHNNIGFRAKWRFDTYYVEKYGFRPKGEIYYTNSPMDFATCGLSKRMIFKNIFSRAYLVPVYIYHYLEQKEPFGYLLEDAVFYYNRYGNFLCYKKNQKIYCGSFYNDNYRFSLWDSLIGGPAYKYAHVKEIKNIEEFKF